MPAASVTSVTSVTAAAQDDARLYLVTLAGSGTSGHLGPLPDLLVRLGMRSEQDATLALVGSPTPVYRWTTALNGFAVPLTPAQAATLSASPAVALVEKNSVRHLAGSISGQVVGAGNTRRHGGAGVVIGVVDSGIHPESPLFADVPGLGRASTRFTGQCEAGQGWDAGTCNRKLVGANWFVEGFGADRLRASSSLSARDDDGHGTQMASIAAGNGGISVRVHDQRLGSYGGVAPQARLAVYKACWSAPDPDDDGCATADVVSAIDQATRDGVDVLNLSVGGAPDYDTVERALLGAAEAGIVVTAAAGNGGRHSFASHPGPWVTTVGGTTGAVRRGRVVLSSGPRLEGAMVSDRSVGPAPLVIGADARAPGATRAASRVCTPGSLDASRVAGAIVLCERGVVGRVDKSAAVRRADGIGMVLANVKAGSVDADFHSVPTVHLDRIDAGAVRRWARAHPGGRVRLTPLGLDRPAPRVVGWSSSGDPSAATLKPDLLAPAVGVLGAVPPGARDSRWDFVSGTSAATAYTSGAAALLLRRRGWSATAVRSALVTTALPVLGHDSVLRTGAGQARPERALRPGLVYAVPPTDYRQWLDGDLVGDLNTTSLLLSGATSTATRTITNIGRRATYFSSAATGFANHRVLVTPAAVRLGPGESVTYTVQVTRPAGPQSLDDGWITWRSAHGSSTRIPALITR